MKKERRRRKDETRGPKMKEETLSRESSTDANEQIEEDDDRLKGAENEREI